MDVAPAGLYPNRITQDEYWRIWVVNSGIDQFTAYNPNDLKTQLKARFAEILESMGSRDIVPLWT